MRELAVPRDPACPVCGSERDEALALRCVAPRRRASPSRRRPDEPTLPAKEWTAIRKVIGDQLAALKAGDGTKAMTFATPGIRAQFGTPRKLHAHGARRLRARCSTRAARSSSKAR